MALIESIAFNNDTKRFVSRHSYSAEVMESLGDALLSFNGGDVYLHGGGTLYQESSITYVSNQEPSNIKLWSAIGIEGNTLPSLVEFSNELPYVQQTDLLDSDFTKKEGVYYATLYRDKNSPNVASGASALLTGDKMRSQSLKVLLKFTNTSNEVILKHVNIIYKDSDGHNI